MSAKKARYKDAKWLAYDAANGENEFFLTFEDAEAWLGDCNDEGIAEETELGLSYIARITHHTAMEITDRKENYHEHSDACPKDCDEEEWPYDSEYDHVGRVYMAPIDTAESAPASREESVSRAIDWARSRDDGDGSPARVLADAVDVLRAQLAEEVDTSKALGRALSAEKALREALEEIARPGVGLANIFDDHPEETMDKYYAAYKYCMRQIERRMEIARAALQGGKA